MARPFNSGWRERAGESVHEAAKRANRGDGVPGRLRVDCRRLEGSTIRVPRKMLSGQLTGNALAADVVRRSATEVGYEG